MDDSEIEKGIKELLTGLKSLHLIKEKCCKKEESPLALTVLGDYIKLANGQYVQLNSIERFKINDSTIEVWTRDGEDFLVYEAKTTYEAKNILDGLMKALAEKKFFHMNAIVEHLDFIGDRLNGIERALREEL